MANISGNLSDDARLIIVKESDWTVESNTTESAGDFEVTDLLAGAKTVISIASSGEAVGYGGVTAVTPPPPPDPDPILHTAWFFGSYNDGYLAAWGSSLDDARTANTAGEINDNYAQWGQAIRASKTGFGGSYDYMVQRSYFDFDLSNFSLTGRTLQDVKLEIRGYPTNPANRETAVILQQSSHNVPLQVEDFDALGSAVGGPITWNDYESDETTLKKNIFTLNTTGKNYVSGQVGTGLAKFCARENHHDYDGNNTTVENQNGVAFSERSVDLDWTVMKYVYFGPKLVLEYMKVPVWSSYFNQDYWEPYEGDSDSATWNGTGWAPGTWGSIDLTVKAGTSWHSNYKPLKIRITFTGAATTELFFWSDTHWNFELVENNGDATVITSGQELEIDWHYSNDHIYEIYIDDPNVVITNIEFLER